MQVVDHAQTEIMGGQTILQPEPKPGDSLQVLVLSLDIVGHSDLVKKYPNKAHQVLSGFRDLVERSIAEFQGAIWHWAGDGAIAAFWGERHIDRGTLAGIRTLQNLSLFNLDIDQNGLQPIEVRIGGNAGEVNYSRPEGKISSVVINEAAKLEAGRTRAAEFTIFESVFYRLDSRIKTVFKKVSDGFRGQRVFSYAGEKRQERLTDVAIDEILNNSIQIVSNVISACNGIQSTAIERTVVAGIYKSTKIFYDGLTRFLRSFSELDPQWSRRYLKSLRSKTAYFLQLEESAWSELKNLLFRLESTEQAPEEYRLLSALLVNTHAEQEVGLTMLIKKIDVALGSWQEDGVFEELVRSLVDSDELEAVSAFVNLFSGTKQSDLVDTLASSDSLAASLAGKLWSLVDLLLIERSQATFQEDDPILKCLGSRPDSGPQIRVLRFFMCDNPPIEELFVRRLRAEGIDPRLSDLEVLWRAIIAAHPNINYRFQAAQNAPISALWQLVTYSKTPLPSLGVTTQRVHDREEKDLKKIYFDCIRPRLQTSLSEGLSNEVEVKVIGDILNLLFQEDTYIDAPYFQDLEALLALFKAQCQRLGIPAPEFAQRLSTSPSKAEADPPEAIEELPPTVQRHLAKHGSFVEALACHDDTRIAKETSRYFIDSAKVDRLAQYCVRKHRVPNTELVKRLPIQLRKRLLTDLHDTFWKGRNRHLAEQLKRRLSKAELEWLRRRNRL